MIVYFVLTYYMFFLSNKPNKNKNDSQAFEWKGLWLPWIITYPDNLISGKSNIRTHKKKNRLIRTIYFLSNLIEHFIQSIVSAWKLILHGFLQSLFTNKFNVLHSILNKTLSVFIYLKGRFFPNLFKTGIRTSIKNAQIN